MKVRKHLAPTTLKSGLAIFAGLLLMGAAPASDADPSCDDKVVPAVVPAAKLAAAVATPAPLDPAAARKSELIDLAKRDPTELVRQGRAKLEREIKDYSCLFIKQEFIKDKLKDVEEIEVRYRNQPTSVFMFWKKNEDRVKRALYVDSPKNVNSSGQKVAKVEPAGAIVRLLVSEVELPIHGKEAKEASRRTIDEFGFKSTLDILEKYNRIAQQAGHLEYRFDGESAIDGRPTFVFVRHLPYGGAGGKYPDAKMVLHLDQEWLLPTAVYSYADREGKRLLGSYVYTKIRLNPGFKDSDFQF